MEQSARVKNLDSVYDAVMLPAYEDLKADKLNYARSFYTQYCNTDPFTGKRLVEPYGEHMYIVQNPPSKPLSQQEMDETIQLSLHADLSSVLRERWWRPGYFGSKIQPDQQQRMFWRLQFLCADVPSGTNHTDEKS